MDYLYSIFEFTKFNFNNREIAIVIWVGIFFVWTLIVKGITTLYWEVLKSFFALFSHLIFLLSISYIFLLIYILYKTELWDPSLLKITILWALAAIITILNQIQTLAKKNGAFKSAILAYFKLFVIIEFVANFYTFSIWAELIIIPLTTLIVMLQAYNDIHKKNDGLSKLFNKCLSGFGLYLIYNALLNIWNNWQSFFNQETLIEFTVPIVLSTLFLPFMFMMSLIAKYKSIYSHLKIYFMEIKDEQYKKAAFHYLVWSSLIAFKNDDKAFNVFHREMTSTEAQSIANIKTLIADIKGRIKADKSNAFVNFTQGWSPYKIRKALREQGFDTDYYHPICNGDYGWSCSKDGIFVDNDKHPQNSLSYSISGTEHVATSLKISLFVQNDENSRESRERLQKLACILFKKALNDKMPSSLSKKLHKGISFTRLHKDKVIELTKEDLSITDKPEYLLNFYIRNKDAEHYK